MKLQLAAYCCTFVTATLLASGCGSQPNNSVKQQTSQADGANDKKQIAESESESEADSTRKEKPDVVVTREDLTKDLERYENESGWNFEARADGMPIGTWRSEDDDQVPLVFAKDGSFKCGFTWREGKGSIAKGYYAIANDGFVAAVAAHKSARLGVFYRLEADGKLYGSRGPSPRVAWRKVSDKDLLVDQQP